MFIKLSVINRDNSYVYVNKNGIAAFGPVYSHSVSDSGCKGSWVIANGMSQDITVNETPDQIMEMLK